MNPNEDRRAVSCPSLAYSLVTISKSEISNIIFRSPSTVYLAGPSQSGKSSLMTQILKKAHEIISAPPTRIVYCCSREIDSLKRQFNKIEFLVGLPDLNMFDPSENISLFWTI
jgi:predicted AAA+ superfamily ATPase